MKVLPFSDMSERHLGRAIALQGEHNGAETFIMFGQTRYTFADTNTRVNELAAGLAKLGLGVGDRIAFCMSSAPQAAQTAQIFGKTEGALTNMKYSSLILIFACLTVQARELVIPSRAIATKATVDFTVDGDWNIQFNQSDWEKKVGGKRYTLFPDKENRSTEVTDLMDEIIADFDIYIIEYVNVINYANGTTMLDYRAARLKEDGSCHVFIRRDGRQAVFEVLPADNTPAAVSAMRTIVSNLDDLEALATDNKDYE